MDEFSRKCCFQFASHVLLAKEGNELLQWFELLEDQVKKMRNAIGDMKAVWEEEKNA